MKSMRGSCTKVKKKVSGLVLEKVILAKSHVPLHNITSFFPGNIILLQPLRSSNGFVTTFVIPILRHLIARVINKSSKKHNFNASFFYIF